MNNNGIQWTLWAATWATMDIIVEGLYVVLNIGDAGAMKLAFFIGFLLVKASLRVHSHQSQGFAWFMFVVALIRTATGVLVMSQMNNQVVTASVAANGLM